jgi:hypothetical protein
MSKPLSVIIEGPDFSYSDARTVADIAGATEAARRIAQYAMGQFAALTKRDTPRDDARSTEHPTT